MTAEHIDNAVPWAVPGVDQRPLEGVSNAEGAT